jgi:cell division control protein 45
MILQLENWYLGYSQILSDCRQGGSALILCNADVDAIAAGRILSYMLRNDTVAHQILPCMSYSQLQKRVNDSCNQDIKALVLLNVGASRNLTRLFNDDEFGQMLNPMNTKLYVMDCRRPVHLANIHAETSIVVFWDGVQEDDELPSDGDNLSGSESSSDEDGEDGSVEDSLDDGENEFEMNDPLDGGDGSVETSSSKLDAIDEHEMDYDGEDESEVKKRSRGDSNDEASLTAEEIPKDDDTNEPEKREHPTMTPRELHQDRRNRLRHYYSSGSYHGTPAAFTAYTMASQIRFRENGDLLWLACVGVTDAYIHARLDVSGYSALAMQLRNNCHKIFPNDEITRFNNTVYSEQLSGKDSTQLTRIALSENGRILVDSDFRFFLLRHASLLDAMVFSDYVSTRLQLLTASGMLRLKEMLAKMGFPLEECHQPYAFMKSSLRRQLPAKLRDYAEEYGLRNFEFTSFFRVTGYQSLLSASDAAYAVTALLEYETPEVTSLKSGEADEEERLVKIFNIAFDSLNSNQVPVMSLNGSTGEGGTVSNLVNGGNLAGNTGLGAGICLAMSLQKTIISTASSLMERNAIVRLSHFRYAYITCTSQGENDLVGSDENMNVGNSSNHEQDADHIFSKPLALTRLAHYLMDFYRENGKWSGNKARPLILMAEKPRTKSFMVVGYEFPESAGDLVKNRFGKNFELAAQSMKGRFRFDSFDSNVVEVARVDVQRFLEQLHYLLDSL